MYCGVRPGRSCSPDCREHDNGIIAERGHGFKGHVASTLDRPFVGLLHEYGADEAGDGGLLSESCTDKGRYYPPAVVSVQCEPVSTLHNSGQSTVAPPRPRLSADRGTPGRAPQLRVLTISLCAIYYSISNFLRGVMDWSIGNNDERRRGKSRIPLARALHTLAQHKGRAG